MVYRTYENRTDKIVLFHIPNVEYPRDRYKHFVVYSGQSVEIELIENPNGLNSWEKAEYFGLTLKKGTVQNISKAELPPEALAVMMKVEMTEPVQKKKRGRKKRRL